MFKVVIRGLGGIFKELLRCRAQLEIDILRSEQVRVLQLWRLDLHAPVLALALAHAAQDDRNGLDVAPVGCPRTGDFEFEFRLRKLNFHFVE